MKFHALTLCLAGSLAMGIAASAQDYRDSSTRSGIRESRTHESQMRIRGDVNRGYESIYAGETLYYRDVLYPDLPPLEVVAQKVSEITEKNRREAADLRQLATRAQAQGFTNVAAVFEHMASDHSRGADFATTWLVNNEFTPPAEPTATVAADMEPVEAVHHMIAMHERSFDEALEKRRNEPSSTVRGMLLMQAATAARHLTLMRLLDRDLRLGRKTLSARLEAELSPTLVAGRFEEIYTRIEEEDRFLYAPPAAVVAQQPVVEERIVERIVEKPVEVERIVEKPVERIVEKPVIQERVVYRDRIVYRNRPASRVAGRRQSSRMRRPAK